MSRIAESTIQEVDDKADALAVVGEYVRLEKRGGRYWGLCPFHNEKTPSFSVDPDRKFFYCFGCHKGGGMVSFIMELEKISYPEAVESLAKKMGIPVVYEGDASPRKAPESESRVEQLAELYRRVAISFNHLLLSTEAGAPAREYLKNRGVNAEMIQKFRLGYAPRERAWLFRFLRKKGYSEAFLTGCGLFSAKNPRSSFFGDRLMFPIADQRGRTVAFGGRLLAGEGPKYLNSPESELYKKRETLFAADLALPEIRRSKEAYVCEGYMDVIALHQAGLNTAVAPLGTAFTDDQARLLRRWAERVHLVFDSDDAGQRAAVKGILTCRANGLACTVVDIAAGMDGTAKDPADILKDVGPEALQRNAKCFINDFDYLLKRGRILYDINSSEGKAQAAAFLFPYLETLESEVSRDSCVGAIADAFGVDRGAVSRDYARRKEPKRSESRPGAGTATIRMNEELFLLIAVAVNYQLYPQMRASLSVEEIDDPSAKELFITLEECYRNDSVGMDALLSRLTDDALKAFVLEKGATGEFANQPERLVADGISRIKAKRLERRMAEIVIRLRVARNVGHGAERELDDLLAEKVHIDAELRRLKEDHE